MLSSKMTGATVVLHVIPTLEIGGAERQLALLCTEQASRGYSVHIALRRSGKFAELLNSKNVSIHTIGDYSGINPLLLFNLNKLITVISPTIVQTWLTQMDIVGGVAALLNRIPWIATERTSLAFYKKERRLYNFLRTRLLAFSSGIVANSLDGMAMWKKILPSHFISFIINAVDFDGISRGMAAKSTDEDENTILLVGRLIESKGFTQVVDAISGLPADLNLKFKIIGQGPIAENLIAQIKKHRLEGQVQLIQNNPEWWPELANAKLLISMSRFEGIPNVVLEAVASGCPVLLSDIPAHREIFCEDTTLFVDLENRDKLIDAIKAVFGDYREARKRAEKAKRVVIKMSVVEMANSYDCVYQKALWKKL